MHIVESRPYGDLHLYFIITYTLPILLHQMRMLAISVCSGMLESIILGNSKFIERIKSYKPKRTKNVWPQTCRALHEGDIFINIQAFPKCLQHPIFITQNSYFHGIGYKLFITVSANNNKWWQRDALDYL